MRGRTVVQLGSTGAALFAFPMLGGGSGAALFAFPTLGGGSGAAPPAAPVSPAVGQRAEGYLTASDGARLFYRVVGQGPDTVIAIHGGPGVDLESIAGDFEPLTRAHTVIFYDQRGAGRSELPKDTTTLNAKRQVADLDDVRRHFGLERVALVAHSYGPLLAATYALAHPAAVSGMVFFGPVPPRRGNFWQRFAAAVGPRTSPEDQERLRRAMVQLNAPDGNHRQACRDYWEAALKPRLAEPERTRPLLRSDLCASDPAGIRFGLTVTNRLVMGSYGDWDLREQLQTLDVPVLILHGEEEAIPMDLVEEWVASLRSARLVKVPRAAHFAYAERPELVWPEVERFLSGLRH
ncbi:MAG: alpha/beta fold hydrolase [Gemmatimonadales bacterium]